MSRWLIPCFAPSWPLGGGTHETSMKSWHRIESGKHKTHECLAGGGWDVLLKKHMLVKMGLSYWSFGIKHSRFLGPQPIGFNFVATGWAYKSASERKGWVDIVFSPWIPHDHTICLDLLLKMLGKSLKKYSPTWWWFDGGLPWDANP